LTDKDEWSVPLSEGARFFVAALAGLDSPLACEACEEEYDELAYEG
jgi:hypothetical protein